MVKKNKGFTLVELIIVIAIIGILAAVLIPSISGYITKARRSNDVQLAGAMTNEIQNYCAKYDLDVKNLLGTDIRTILLYRGFDLEPRRDDWTFVFDRTSTKVEVVDFNEEGVFADEVHVPLDPTHVVENYFLLGKGESGIEKAVDILCNLSVATDFDSALELVTDSDYLEVLNEFNPDNTLYIIGGGIVTSAVDPENIKKVVCTELVTHLPKLVKNSVDFAPNIPTTNLPQVLRTSEVANSKFPNAKVVDVSKVNKIDLKQLGFEYKDDDDDPDANFVYKFQLGKYVVDSKLQVFSDEIISVLKISDSTNDYAVKRKFTISYYNEDGLFATGYIYYSVNQAIELEQ